MPEIAAAALENRPIAALAPYPYNPRRHNGAQVEQLAASIEAFGFVNPVLVDPSGGIVAGHGRVMAARWLVDRGTPIRGADGVVLPAGTVPCLVLGHLSDAQRKAYIIADNRLAETGGGWDQELLQQMLVELHDEGAVDLGLTGFAADEIRAILAGWDVAEHRAVVDQVAPTLEGILVRVTVVCPVEQRAAVRAAVAEAVASSGIDGARVQ